VIPVSKPCIGEQEVSNVAEVLRSGMIASGEWVKRFEEEFTEYVGTKYAVATTSGTVALDITLKALSIKSGDEVIVPDFTFISTANAVLFQGARPAFADVDEGMFNINPEDVLEKITPHTKAVIGVHLFGQPFNIRAIQEICEDYALRLIEDCAQAHGAEYDGQKVGRFGDVGCFSFYATKPMTTGEGGMLTTGDRELEKRLRLLVNHGQSEKYVHTALGYNYRMTNIQAAIGTAQLEKLDGFNEQRAHNAQYLNEHVKLSGIELPHCEGGGHVYHQYVLKVSEGASVSRDELVRHLSEAGIGTAIHYPLPVHQQPLYLGLGYDAEQCPVATGLSKGVLSLPVHPALTDQELSHICNVINSLE